MNYTNDNDVVKYTQMCHYNVGLSTRLEQILDHNNSQYMCRYGGA